MIVILLVLILAVLLFGAPAIIEGAMALGAIGVAACAAVAVVLFVVAALADPLGAVELALAIAVFAGWCWGFARYRWVRWAAVGALGLAVTPGIVLGVASAFGFIK